MFYKAEVERREKLPQPEEFAAYPNTLSEPTEIASYGELTELLKQESEILPQRYKAVFEINLEYRNRYRSYAKKTGLAFIEKKSRSGSTFTFTASSRRNLNTIKELIDYGNREKAEDDEQHAKLSEQAASKSSQAR
jgi:hypothetical protein